MRKRKGGLSITFDEHKRRDYLLGFQKRKKERRRKAKHDIEEKLKEERKNVRDMKRKESHSRGVHADLAWNEERPEENEEEPPEEMTLDMPAHSVRIWQLGQLEGTHNDLFLGRNNEIPGHKDLADHPDNTGEVGEDGRKQLPSSAATKAQGNPKKFAETSQFFESVRSFRENLKRS
ncbi:nucleolar protein 12-like isoform X2 [Paramacrobiotus metropolitanus]|uniref:nucleolar protein 12-like isoform X2 n=1 Tax=Paramacrobiotus metropolitanus TaxID=2943436 RepID=UPI0024456936|nr:nucleolar protein 12-like isoform X2 [Paramacrobiotus metropolitanus]